MSFEAYIVNIRARTGKSPQDFFDEAVRLGVLHAGTRPMEFVRWLMGSSGLGHGHSMAVWEALKRQGRVPLAATGEAAPRPPRRPRA